MCRGAEFKGNAHSVASEDPRVQFPRAVFCARRPERTLHHLPALTEGCHLALHEKFTNRSLPALVWTGCLPLLLAVDLQRGVHILNMVQ